MGGDRAALLAQVAEAHHEWVTDHVDELHEAPGQGAPADANVWELEHDGDPDREADFAARVGELDFSAAGGLVDDDDQGAPGMSEPPQE